VYRRKLLSLRGGRSCCGIVAEVEMGRNIIVKNRFDTVRLDENSILYIEKELRKVIVHTEQKNYWEYCVMDKILGQADEQIYQCHRSLAVNLDKIAEITNTESILQNGHRLYMCRAALQKLRRVWEAYLNRL
jgi:two-component system LytT family response regulator